MIFNAKLRRIGNSAGVYIPKKIIKTYELGDIVPININPKIEEEEITYANKSKYI